jgi:hypothetical protein
MTRDPSAVIDMTLYYSNKGAERITHTMDGRQVWKQVGWLGLSTNRVYSIGQDFSDDPAGAEILWILMEDEQLPPPDDAP